MDIKRIITLILILIFIGEYNCFSQNAFNFNMQTSYDDYFTNFIQINNDYLITGFQVNQNASSSYSVSRNFITKVDNNGNLIQNVNIDTFNTEYFYYTGLLYNNNVFLFGINGVGKDSSSFCVWKGDTNLNFLTKRVYNNVKFKGSFEINGDYHLNDSIVTLLCNYFDSVSTYHPFIINVNLNSLEIENTIYLNESFYLNDYTKGVSSNTYCIIASMPENNYLNSIVRYDLNFNLLDTINLQFYPSGNSNIFRFQDDKYIYSAEGPNIWNIDPNIPDFFDKLRITVVDSNFNFIFQKSFGDIDSSDVRTGYGFNLVRNNSNQYFAGGYLTEGLFNTSHPDLGVIIAKLDSNLNEIWHKNIPGNSRCWLERIQPTDDGGVLMLVNKGAKNGNSADAFFMKIGPNGEVTNITDLGFKARKAIVSIYPNPTSEKLRVSLLAKNKIIGEIQIYDLQFKEILNRKINTKQTTIDVSKFAKGVYIIEGKTDTGESFWKKFVVE